MQSLLLAIASSALVSIIMRFSEGKVGNKMGFFMANYLVCTLLAGFFVLNKPIVITPFAIGLGVFSGFVFLYSFVLYRQNIGKNGMVMSATFMKLGVLIPTLMAIFIFRESPSVLQILGIVLALGAIILLHFEKDAAGQAQGKWLLLLLLLVSGFTDGTANIFDKLGTAESKDVYLIFTFLTAFVCAAGLALRGGQKVTVMDILFGAAIGIPNYFSSRFLLGALETVPAVVVYPVYSVGTIVVITLVGVAVFHEQLNRKKLISLGIIFAALALLNL